MLNRFCQQTEWRPHGTGWALVILIPGIVPGCSSRSATVAEDSTSGNPADAGKLPDTAPTPDSSNVSKPGVPTPLLADIGLPYVIAIDNKNLYWASKTTGVVGKVPLSGGAPTTLTQGISGPEGIVVSATHVYYSHWVAKTVERVPIAGGSVEIVADQQGLPNHLAVDATHIYWSNYVGHVRKKPLSGGQIADLGWQGNVGGIIAVDDTAVFAVLGDGEVRRQDKNGTTWKSLTGPISVDDAGTSAGATGIGLDQDHVYVAMLNAHQLVRVHKTSGKSEVLVDKAHDVQPHSLVVDANHVYFTTNDSIMRVSKTGGTPELLAADENHPYAIVGNETTIYWSSLGDLGDKDGSLRMMAKPK